MRSFAAAALTCFATVGVDGNGGIIVHTSAHASIVSGDGSSTFGLYASRGGDNNTDEEDGGGAGAGATTGGTRAIDFDGGSVRDHGAPDDDDGGGADDNGFVILDVR